MCSNRAVKNISKRMFSKSVVIVILALLDRFRGPSWLILDGSGPKNWGHNLLRIDITQLPFVSYFLDQLWDHFVGIVRVRIGQKGTKNGTSSGPACSGSGGVGSRQNAK